MRQRAWFFTGLPAAVALAGLLALSSAAALNRFVAIDAQHIDYHDITSDSIELQQRIDSPTPGPATQTVSGSNWLSTGSIDFGAAGHAYTSGNLTSTASGSHSIH